MPESDGIDGTYPVVIAGGGPVGTMLACGLRQAGVDVLVLERRTEPDLLPRAGSMGPLAFEALERLGLHDALLAAEQDTLAEYGKMFADWAAKKGIGQPATRSAPKEHFAGLEKIDPARRTDPERRRVRVEQPVLEEILHRHAVSLGAVILRGHEIVGVFQDEERVIVDVRTVDGTVAQVTTQYLVGADGADSSVRGFVGFDFPGTDATVTGRMAVVELADEEKLSPGFHYTPVGLYVHGLGVNRLSTVEFDGPPTDDEDMTAEELQGSIRRVSGTDVTISEMSSGTRWIDTARQASAYRLGRVLLAGDAAHVYAPVGGQGLNVGLVDAANLVWKLAAQVQRWAPHYLLDTYGSERYPVAARLLQNTRAQIALMHPDPQTTALREMFEELLDIDEVHRTIADMMAGMDVRYAVEGEHPLLGTLVPDAKLTGGKAADLWADGRGVLVDFADRADVRDAVGAWSARVNVVTLPGAREDVDALLVRPDGCVVWALPTGAALADAPPTEALTTWFGRAPRVS
uniref:Oxygenase n=1 Tax=Streptomyces sp. R1128 TaxID=140437 RepID=Q9F6C9_9ACTN|nr:oxygenase [Streptomyces sp. R1128]